MPGLLLMLLVSGCQSLYFDPAQTAEPHAEPLAGLHQWPFDEYWTGIVFNGHKIGFTHLRIVPDVQGTYRIESDAALRLRFLGYDKRVQLSAIDVVNPDLTLRSFDYDYLLDNSRLQVSGRVYDGRLHVEVSNAGQQQTQDMVLDQPLYPSAVIAMYPLLGGLQAGRRYTFTIYDGETQQLAEVSQHIAAYEVSSLFEGPAHKVITGLHGKQVESWLNRLGLPVLEVSLNGVLIADLESEERAGRYLAAAAFNKQDLLLEFSRIPADREIAAPRDVDELSVRLLGVPAEFPDPVDTGYQQCVRIEQGLRCRITKHAGGDVGASTAAAVDLQPTFTVPSVDPRLQQAARDITAPAGDQREQIDLLVRWLDQNIQKVAEDSYSALDVYESRRAECQGHSYLYAAFARSRALPTRVVNGLVYSELVAGFLYHTWTETLVDGQWIPVDPTFGQVFVDATHVRLLVGEDLAALTPLTSLFGRLRAEIIAVH